MVKKHKVKGHYRTVNGKKRYVKPHVRGQGNSRVKEVNKDSVRDERFSMQVHINAGDMDNMTRAWNSGEADDVKSKFEKEEHRKLDDIIHQWEGNDPLKAIREINKLRRADPEKLKLTKMHESFMYPGHFVYSAPYGYGEIRVRAASEKEAERKIKRKVNKQDKAKEEEYLKSIRYMEDLK